MRLPPLMKHSVAALSLLMTSSLGYAQSVNDSGPYIGASYGFASFSDNEFDDDNTVGQLFAGLQLNRFLGVEASLVDFGRYGGRALRASTDGWSLGLTGTLPLTETFSLFAKAGQFWWDTNISSDSFSRNYSNRDWYYAVGLSAAITQRLDFRLSYDRVELNLGERQIGSITARIDTDVNILSAGLKFSF